MSLLAIAICHSTFMSSDRPLSRAGSLLQVCIPSVDHRQIRPFPESVYCALVLNTEVAACHPLFPPTF
ncbi:hypothetical protein PkoCFBP13504_26755 [Pseudomonas koreensis]|nr:hypothetical protein PkoCFBP13504_26755 [Pseudomonas koreensis]